MSSKSRKESVHPPAAAPVPHARSHEHEGLLGDEVIHVPKGRSRLSYALMIGLLIFMTVIFLVPGALITTFLGPGRDDPETLAYTRPDGSRRVLHASELVQERRVFDEVFSIIEILKLMMGIEENNPSDETIARLIVLDDVARSAGIRITDAELATFLSSLQVDRDTWRAITSRYGGPGRVEPKLKRVLGIRRYIELTSQIARVPDVAAIEERWANEHVEVAYDHVSIPVEDMVEAARAEAPDDAALQAWLDARPEFEKAIYQRPATYRATFAVFKSPEETPATGLLEAYPDSAGEDPEATAENYYNQVFFARFQRPPEETEEAAEGEEGEDAEPAEGEDATQGEAEGEEPSDEEPPSPYLSLDEVRDAARAEAPVYFAMQSWVGSLQERIAAGEAIDLGAEAEAMGLGVIRIDEPATLVELREQAGLGTFAVGPIGATQPGEVSPRVIADQGGLIAVQVDEKLDPAMPPFEEIRDQVLDAWARERAGELAVERLAALRAQLEPLAPAEAAEGEEPAAETDRRHASEEAFRAAAEAAGLEVKRRDWLDKSAPPNEAPDPEDPGHRFLTQHREYAEMEEGEVAEPALDRARSAAYLVRLVGARPVDIARMTPQVYNGYKAASSMSASTAVRSFLLGEGLDDVYGVTWLVDMDDDASEVDEGAPDEAAAPAGEDE